MSNFDTVDLTKLPPPNVVEALDYESILAEYLADLRVRDPEFSSTVESDPAYAILEVAAYRELKLRQRINDAARALMLATAQGADLENLGAYLSVKRLIITEAITNVLPPVEAVYETDEALRRRIQLAPESITSAGSRGSYLFWTLSASGLIKDADISRPVDGVVQVALLSNDADGTPTQQIIDLVDDSLTEESKRPLCDTVRVISVQIVNYIIDAELTFYAGPDALTVLGVAQIALQKYVDESHKCGRDITLSGINAALKQPGVQNVKINSPVNDLVLTGEQAGFCTSINITNKGVSE